MKNLIKKTKQLEFEFVKEMDRKRNIEDLKIVGKSFGLMFGIFAIPAYFVFAPLLYGLPNSLLGPDRFHRKDAIARYVEPIDGISKGACYQGFDTDSDKKIDKILCHQVHYHGAGMFVPSGVELTEKSGNSFYEAKDLLLKNNQLK